jgi:hypothetical protein
MQDPPLSSSTLLDNDAIDAMKVAVDIAPSIWGSMGGLIRDIVSAKFDVSEALINVKALIKRLNDNIKAVRESDPTADTKALRDAFVKVCLSPCFNTDLGMANLGFWVLCCFCVSDGNFIRQYLQESWNRKTVAGRPTSEMILLMNATEESVMLLHVSSFSPSTSRPYSPLVSAGGGFGLATRRFSLAVFGYRRVWRRP